MFECPYCETPKESPDDECGCDSETIIYLERELNKCQRERDALAEVVKDASKRQRQCLEIMRKNNLVLDNLDDPMQKLAFTFYTELVAIAMQADNALAMLDGFPE